MDNIFYDLEQFGISNISKFNHNIFEEELYKAEYPPGANPDQVMKENIRVLHSRHEEFLFIKPKSRVAPGDPYFYIKEFKCPVCAAKFKVDTLKETKVKLEAMEYDLRPVYRTMDPLFYEILTCESCGYSASKKNFDRITAPQKERILAVISPTFHFIPIPKEPSVDEVIARFKLALYNAIVKSSGPGERAYLCMKLTWLYRIQGDLEKEKRFAALAKEGFTLSLSKEVPPVMEMQESVILYVLAANSLLLGDADYAVRLLSELALKKIPKSLKDRVDLLKFDALECKKTGEPFVPVQGL